MSQLIFKNYGGSYQLRIQNAKDLEKIQALDEAHWAATSVPINSLNCDPVFAAYVDTDKNGRIMTNEIKDSQSWLFRVLANRSRLSEGSDVLDLNDIDTGNPEGKKIRAAAELVLTNLNSQDSGKISLSQARDVQSIMDSAASNGDGVIPPEAVSDSGLSQFITSVIETIGSVLDAGGKPGISQGQLKLFFQEAEGHLVWKEKGKIPQGKDFTEVMPWGNDTVQAYDLIAGLEDKIEQYFAQCAMVRVDEKSADKIQFSRKELEEIDFKDKSVIEALIKDAPLAKPNPKSVLDLEGDINPLYVERLSLLKEKVLPRALGGLVKHLSSKQWDKVKNVFVSYRSWLESEQGVKVKGLGEDRLRAYLNGDYRKQVSGLIEKDAAVADELNQMRNLEKLILYQ